MTDYESIIVHFVYVESTLVCTDVDASFNFVKITIFQRMTLLSTLRIIVVWKRSRKAIFATDSFRFQNEIAKRKGIALK